MLYTQVRPLKIDLERKKTFKFVRTVAVGVQLYKQYFAYRPYIIYYGNGHWVIRAIFVERVVGNMQVAIR